MKMLLIVILILSSYKKANAQIDESIIRQILGDLLNCSTEVYNDTLFFEQHIGNTFFDYDSASIRKKTGLQIPQKALMEITKNSKEIKKDNQWNESQLNEKVLVISVKNDTTLLSRKPYIKCLSEKQMDFVSAYLPTLSMYSISRLIFDNNHQTAIFQLDNSRGGRHFFSESILIKKIFGSWIIVKRFDFIMS